MQDLKAGVVPVDLRTQLEDLLGAVWAAEANWTFDDRLDLATADPEVPAS